MRLPLLAVIALLVISLCFITTAQADSLYDICSNPSCSLSLGVPIQYPFGTGSRGCGHPDFQVECDTEFSDTTVRLNIKGRKYSIRMAFFTENTLNVLDVMVRKSSCYLPNASVDFTGSPFEIVSPYSNLTYLLNCSKPIKTYSKIDCGNASYLGVDYNNASKLCTSNFQVPIAKIEPGDFTGNLTQDIKLWQMRMLLSNGFWIKWDQEKATNENCSSCKSSEGVCGYNVSNSRQEFLCFCKDGTQDPKNCSKGRSTEEGIIIGSCIGGLVVLVAATAMLVGFLFKRKKEFTLATKNASDDSEFDRAEMGDLPIFSYRELELATNYFDEKRELGGGGYGKVYLGKLRDGRSVAVKRFHENNCDRFKQFINEVKILSSVRHCNLVRLFGCCKERENLLLVCEYVPNRTLFDHLHGEQRGKKGLQWDVRLKIALETASALAYLHFDNNPPIYHRDVKSTNILLDEKMGVKVADFGLSRLMPLETSRVSTSPQGTPGYVDPDYGQFYQLTDKSDVYSFGVVLIEIISGLKAVDELRDGREISLAHLATTKIQSGSLHELVDPDLEFESDPAVNEMITSVAELAFLCLSAEKDDRPCMLEIVTQLHRIKQLGYGCLNCRNMVSLAGIIKPDSESKATGSSNIAPPSPDISE